MYKIEGGIIYLLEIDNQLKKGYLTKYDK